MSYTVLARRYRSRTFEELIGQEPIARTLRNAIEHDRTAHAYLFCGTRGVGKTSMARIFAKALNATPDLVEVDAIGAAILRGDDLDVIEIDGASNRGVEEARSLIAGAGLSPTRCRYKIYIIDEVHMLTREAFNALLKTMEEPPAHVKFILCTTDPHKVPATIQSRCQRFDFRAIATRLIVEQLRRILAEESIEADDAVIMQVARLGRGSMRDALSLLDRLLACGEPRLTIEFAQELLGLPDQTLAVQVLDGVIAADAGAALRSGAELLARGATVELACELLAEHVRSLLLITACGAESELVELSPDALELAVKQAASFDAPALVHMIALCDATARNARNSATARALFDALLVRLCLAERLADVTTLLAGGGTDAKKKKRPSPDPKVTDRPPAAVSVAAPSPPSASARVRTPASRAASEPAPTVTPTRDVAEAPGGGTVVEVKASTSADPDALWQRVRDVAAQSSRDEAKIRHLSVESFDGRTLRLALAAEGPKFLATQAESIVDIVQRATGQSVRVVISTADQPAKSARPGPPSSSRFEEVARLPAVQKAAEVFDAVIVDVTEARS